MATPINVDQTIKLILNFIKNRISIFSLIDRKIILKETIKHLQILLSEIDDSIKAYKSFSYDKDQLEIF